jgi:hypothetical protein
MYRTAYAENKIVKAGVSTPSGAGKLLRSQGETFTKGQTMKRVGHLWNEIISNGNLFKAIEEVNKSHRWRAPGKPNKLVMEIELHKPEYVVRLRKILEDFYQSTPIPKRRYDRNAKKWRDIKEPKLWPDQYVHHALIQVVMPVMMRGMDRRICGSIPGRGAIDGVKIIKKWMKVPKETRYCLECDIHHFYDSLDPRVVMDRMRRLIKDPKVLDLIWRIVKDGIKIGFYTSQWFGNTVLQPLDQALRDAGVKCYVRYMDNFTLFAGRKRTLTNALKIIESWLNAHGMRLKDNHQIFKIKSKMKKVYGKEGLTRIRERLPNAMGYRFGRGFTIIRKHGLFTIKRNVASFWKKVKAGKYISSKYCLGLLSRLGRLRHCNNIHIYERFVPNGTQRKAKQIIKANRKESLTWNSALEQFKRETISKPSFA